MKNIEKLIHKTALFLFSLLLTSNTLAGTLVCSGKVADIAYHSADRLMVRLDSMNVPVFVCNLENSWSVAGTPYTTGPKTCAAFLSTFLAAKMTGKTINTMYFDGDDVPTTCNGWTHWQNANIRFFNLIN